LLWAIPIACVEESSKGTRDFYFSAVLGLVSVRAVPNNPVYSFFATRGSLAPFFIRLSLASVFFYHGVQKTFGWFGGSGWTNTLALWTSAESYNVPYVVGAFVLVAEVAVSIALTFGLFTRLAGLAVVCMMGGVLIFTQEGASFDAVEFPVVLIAAGLSLMITGGGYLSLDRAISVNLLPQVG
jgi:putative oxidoreductase